MVQGGTKWLTASSDHSQAVVLKVSKSIGTPLDELYFPVEAFGNAIVFGEPPHGGDFAPPTVEGFSQSLHRSKLLGYVLLDVAGPSFLSLPVAELEMPSW